MHPRLVRLRAHRQPRASVTDSARRARRGCWRMLPRGDGPACRSGPGRTHQRRCRACSRLRRLLGRDAGPSVRTGASRGVGCRRGELALGSRCPDGVRGRRGGAVAHRHVDQQRALRQGPAHHVHGRCSRRSGRRRLAAGARRWGFGTEMGIAASGASGLKANFGSMAKPLHAGRLPSGACSRPGWRHGATPPVPRPSTATRACPTQPEAASSTTAGSRSGETLGRPPRRCSSATPPATAPMPASRPPDRFWPTASMAMRSSASL